MKYMDFKQLAAARRSIRKFEARKVERTLAESLMRTTLAAPSSRNSHSTRLMAIDNPELISRIAQMRDYGSAFVADAPLAILVMGDRTLTDLWLDNAAISATYMLLAAADEGLGGCWVHVNGRPRVKAAPEQGTAEEYLREFLPIPEDCSVLCAIAIGYPDYEPKPLPEFDAKSKMGWVE